MIKCYIILAWKQFVDYCKDTSAFEIRMMGLSCKGIGALLQSSGCIKSSRRAVQWSEPARQKRQQIFFRPLMFLISCVFCKQSRAMAGWHCMKALECFSLLFFRRKNHTAVVRRPPQCSAGISDEGDCSEPGTGEAVLALHDGSQCVE